MKRLLSLHLTLLIGPLALADPPASASYRVHEWGTFTSVQATAEPFVGEPVPRADHQSPVRHFASPEALHVQYTDDFARRPGFGRSRMVFLPPRDLLTWDGRTYEFETPVLLGLDGQPTAYVSPGPLITVSDLSDPPSATRIPKRPLTPVEREAVKRLKTGLDLVMVPETIRVERAASTNAVEGFRLVGALRVRSRCATCHAKPEGTLLGAFVYTLVPEEPDSAQVAKSLADASTGRVGEVRLIQP